MRDLCMLGPTIGPVALANRAILAPMSGISDWPFRQIAARFGAGLVVSEMVASDRLLAKKTEARLKMEGEGLKVHAVQLAGCRADELAEAARLAEAAGADIIDINMGCPAKRVVGGWAGSALMRNVDHATSLIAATVKAVAVPVTVKMRLGFDQSMRNAPELSRRAEAEGAQLVTIHGRTRCQRYKGVADWSAIRAVKDAVSIPVVGNGDVTDLATARTMLAQSGADGVMIGRAALGAPWLPGLVGAALAGAEPPEGIPATPAALAALALDHHERLLVHQGVELGVRCARKHTAAYAAHLANVPPSLVRAALTAQNPQDARRTMLAMFAAADGLLGDRAAIAPRSTTSFAEAA
ncbi:tRNA dihydrouridine synthase DusB [Acuticoccus sp. M5D2P5]|uniref:tRNA dihydrouridine synthase DusB n=1 Tax=Acuticoccus kalidii TaxID=2910977 RepID=UPI001F26395A|nr:tRNA dihydrouridine synthase DusB [Acuticoccus kalidii]MCF3935077.1 tRNA dihydrouridine synthase DusB [Acuticoccus kalidii]